MMCMPVFVQTIVSRPGDSGPGETGADAMHRRAWLASAALALMPVSASRARPARAAPLTSVGDGVYVWPGRGGEPAPHNEGRVATATVFDCGDAALVVDPGPNRRTGKVLRDAVERGLGLPVRAVINTHAHPEHVLGNAAFADVPIHASARTRVLMQQRCPDCSRRFAARLGPRAMAGTRIVLPTHTLDDGAWLEFGTRRLRIDVFDHAHSEADLSLFDPRSGVLCAGGLGWGDQVPDMAESSLDGWIAALQRLLALSPRVVAGVGPALGTEVIASTQRYLSAMRAVVADAIRQGIELPALLRAPSVAAAHPQDPVRHQLNLQQAWRELEARWWSGTL